MSLNKFVEKETDGYLRLAKQVIAYHADGENLLLSPLSIHIVLAMTAAGAGGSTRAQLLKYLNSERVEQLNSFFSQITTAVLADGSPLGGPLLSTKNGLWVDMSLTLKPAFRDIVHNFYKADAEPADFQNKEAREKVNEWANKETRGLIKEILPPDSITEYNRPILANAVYFKGAWAGVFDPELTRDDDFYLLDGSRIRVPLMRNRQWQYVRAFDGFKVAKLPYKQGKDSRRCSMCTYLPDAKDGLPALTDRICSEPGFIGCHLPDKLAELAAFRFPKFKFEANNVLKKLGVVDLFGMGGLSEMVDSYDSELLFVNRIVQKAFMEVNEEGTEAAVVTEEEDDIGFGMMDDEEPQLSFVADHPFLFLISEERSGVVLFVGQLLNPLVDKSF